MKKHKIDSFILISFSMVILVCVMIIVFFAAAMTKRSNEAITKISTMYMAGMNGEISNHFQTTVELRLNQIETIVDQNPPEKAVYGQEMLDSLAADGKARNFPYLSLMSTEGEFEMIYGEELLPFNTQAFLDSLNNDEKKIAYAHNKNGEKYALFGVSTTYPMSGNRKCTALVGALPVAYLNQVLDLDNVDELQIFSNVITSQGLFIINNFDDDYENYFDRMGDLYTAPTDTNKTINDYIEELKEAIDSKKEYSTVFQMKDEKRHLFCSPLPQSEWYLLMIMPYGEVEEVMADLDHQRGMILVMSVAAIIVIFMVIFLLYYRRTLNQYLALERAREEAVRASRAKSEFLSNMSHDIRTPMNAIVGMTAVAEANIDNKPQLEKCLKNISKSNKHLLGLINDILDMAKIENGKLTLNMEKISLRDLMDDIVAIVQPQIKVKNQQFEVIVYDIIEENVFSDGVRLNQVILNLISNSLKFTPEKGSITLSLHQSGSPLGDDHVRVYLSVKDTGIGMSEEFMKVIFESFSREDSKRVQKTEGTGLGMAITKYIIDAMHGTIEVESELGKGTEFTIIIDMAKADKNDYDMDLGNIDALVVDDNEMICNIVSESLKEMGAKADHAQDGRQALAMTEQRFKANDPYDLFLIDWQMPEMNGLETAQKIRSLYGKNVPIIIISAYDCNDIEEEANAIGVSGFIPKPLFKSTLYHNLNRLLGHKDDDEEVHIGRRNDFTGVRLLIAEDNDLNWEVVSELLSPFGFEMDHAENGKLAVELFEGSEVGYYSAVLMDLRMPVMDGYGATEAIRRLDRPDANVPIIAMTADAFAEDIKKCLNIGMNAHVAKPIDVDKVIRHIENMIQ